MPGPTAAIVAAASVSAPPVSRSRAAARRTAEGLVKTTQAPAEPAAKARSNGDQSGGGLTSTVG